MNFKPLTDKELHEFSLKAWSYAISKNRSNLDQADDFQSWVVVKVLEGKIPNLKYLYVDYMREILGRNGGKIKLRNAECFDVMHENTLIASGPSALDLLLIEKPVKRGPETSLACKIRVKAQIDSDLASLETIEREAILGRLALFSGNRTHAAVSLGISVRTIRNKLRCYKN